MGCHGSHGRLRGKIKRSKLRLIQNNQTGFGVLLPAETVGRAIEAEGIAFAMAQAAEQAGLHPREVSFAGAVQTINAFGDVRAG